MSMTIDEKIAVLQAYKEGKPVQMRLGVGWADRKPTEFNFVAYDYRVKPEPREFWLVKGAGMGFADYVAYDCRQEGCENLHVREVLDGDSVPNATEKV